MQIRSRNDGGHAHHHFRSKSKPIMPTIISGSGCASGAEIQVLRMRIPISPAEAHTHTQQARSSLRSGNPSAADADSHFAGPSPRTHAASTQQACMHASTHARNTHAYTHIYARDHSNNDDANKRCRNFSSPKAVLKTALGDEKFRHLLLTSALL